MTVKILIGDVLARLADLPSDSVHCVITSPPYWGLRDYGVPGQIGLEETPKAYVERLAGVFREVRRVLADDGTLWLNIGDSYATDSKWGGATSGKAVKAIHGSAGGGRNKTITGLPDKNLVGIPWRIAFALQADGWILRQDIIWHKPNPMPESVRDRCTKSHEYVFLLTKSGRYFFDSKAMKEDAVKGAARSSFNTGKTALHQMGRSGTPGRTEDGKRNRRSVWTVPTRPYKGAHFATFPPALVEPCVLAGSRPGDTVLDPFGGAGTTGLVANSTGRHAVLIELNPAYAEIARARIEADSTLFSSVEVA